MADIGSLIVRIGADASGLERAFHQLGGSAKQFGQGLATISGVLQTAFFAATSAAVAMTMQAGKTAEETDQLSQKTGIAADSLEGMTVLMARNGLTGQSLATMMRGLSKEMVGVQRGTAASVKLFTELGVSLDVVERGTGATLRAIADRFKLMANGAEKARLAVELFGRAGLEWIPILNKGGAALDESIRKSVEFGLVLTDTARNDLTVFDDAMDDLQSALKGFAMQVGVAFAPSLTILVQFFTDAIVFAKNAFNQLSDAGSVLSIRLAAMVASVQLLSGTLFSMQAFSKAAWQETINHIKAIDAWAASQIAGVAVARMVEVALEAQAKAHLEAAEALRISAASQKVLGEQAVSFTKIRLAQEQLDYKRFFQTVYVDAKASADARLALERAVYEQNRGIFADVVAVRQAATQAILADVAMRQQVENQALFEGEITYAQYQQRVTNLAQEGEAKRMGIAQQFPTFWQRQLQDLANSNTFAIAQITTAWTGGLATALVRGGDFVKAAWEQTQIAIIQGGLNLAVQWAAQQALMATASTTAAVATTGVWAGATAAITGFFATVTSAFSAMFATMVGIITAVGTFIIGVLSAIAAALTATVFGIPWAGAILVGIALIVAALAAAGAIKFAEGGIVTGPTLGLIGERGPEAVIPLTQLGDFRQETQTTIIVELDGQPILKHVANRLPSMLRLKGVPA